MDLSSILPLDIQIRSQQKAELLQRVAVHMLERTSYGKELNAIAYGELLGILSEYLAERYDKPRGEADALAQGILQHLRERTHILAEIGEGIFGFVHRTFMEYFVASYYKSEFNARKADYEWLKRSVIRRRWQRDDWQEVLLLLVAMLSGQQSPVAEMIEYLRNMRLSGPPVNLSFAVQCLSESGVIRDRQAAYCSLR